jgi:hypothetical protein
MWKGGEGRGRGGREEGTEREHSDFLVVKEKGGKWERKSETREKVGRKCLNRETF